MYVDEPIDQPGFFWLPSNDAERIPGTLKIDDTGHISLSLFGWRNPEQRGDSSPSLNPARPPAFAKALTHDRIHGVLSGKIVTLDRCIRSTSRISLSGGVSQLSYTVLRAYTGAWYNLDEAPTFSRLDLRFVNLHEWLMMSGMDFDFGVDNPYSGRFTLSFDPPEPFSVNLPSGITLSLDLAFSPPSVSLTPTDVSFSQHGYLRLEASGVAHLDELLEIATAFQRLLSIAVDRPCEMTSISGFTPDIVIDDHKLPIRIYTGRTSRPRPAQDVSWHRMLFTFNDVRDRFSDMIIDWLAEEQRLGPALDLYDAVTADAYQQADGRFLATAQAIEALHRRLLEQDPPMSSNEFDKLLGDLVEATPPDKHSWLKARLQHANEPTFRQRVRELVEDFAPYFGDKSERGDFVDSVVKARNRLTHLPADSGDESIDVKSLVRMQKRLELLFLLHLLQQLGFDGEDLDSIAEKRLLPKLEIEFL